MHRQIAQILPLLLAVTTMSVSQAKDYQFERVLAGPLSGSGQLGPTTILGISTSGAVGFTCDLGSFIYLNGVLKPITESSGQYTVQPLAMNDRADFLVKARRGNGPLLLATLSSGTLTPILDLSTRFARPEDLQEVAFNNNGKAALSGLFLGGTRGVITVDSQSTVTITSTTTTTATFSGLVMNDEGTVVFTRFGVPLQPNALVSSSGGSALTTVALAGSTVSFTATSPHASINSSGAIAYVARQTGRFTDNVYLFRDGQTRTLIEGTGYRRISDLVLNDSGEAAFQGTDNGSTSGIFTGPNPITDKVIRFGETLFGRNLMGVVTGGDSDPTTYLHSNDRGQVAFIYVTNDWGVALASPVVRSGPVPFIHENSILNAASFARVGDPRYDIAPGSIMSVFGTDFATGLTVAGDAPLPSTLNGTSLTVNGEPVPLFFVSPNQINAQMPYTAFGTVRVAVVNANGTSAERDVRITNRSPAIFTFDQSGKGQGIITFVNSAALAAPVGLAPGSRPARAGDILTIYLNGLGPVSPSIRSGHNSCDPVSMCAPDFSNLVLRSAGLPQIEIGGVLVPDGNVGFAGLAPQFVGLYQINFTVPQGLPSGPSVPLVIRIGELTSAANVTLALF